ncbi:hypothetical protein [Streptomyces yaizuensis]|uniref:Uncharacterized protein n=1 Tax=Streptomyces yaizuensis TaxID=2989713 RepID=A0AA86MG73_9ACTN|nr:hypothetical protein [Streptomyces sp. YSPA8]BDT39564.1 hypothetical protein SYYSPA8_37230 [Streptomyces sp. YSPA8]
MASEKRILTEAEVGPEVYNALGPAGFNRDGTRAAWTEEEKRRAWTARGEVVNLGGFLYDVQGLSWSCTIDGAPGLCEAWSAYRLPRSHFYIRHAANNGDHVNDGESLPSRDKALALVAKEAARRTLARQAWERHPYTEVPVPFATEIQVRELEPGYWELHAFGHRWRRWNPDRPKGGGPYPAGAELMGTARPPSGYLHHNREWEKHNHLERGYGLHGALTAGTMRLLGATRPDSDCAMCEPGPAWGRHRERKVRVGLDGHERVDEVLCLGHLAQFLLPWRLESLGYRLLGAPTERWREMLHGWIFELTREGDDVSLVRTRLRRRWMAHLRQQGRVEKARRETQARRAEQVQGELFPAD